VIWSGTTLMNNLLTRKEFKRQVFERDNHKCVICGDPAVDAHHIIDRKSWPDGGYYLDNGASVCGPCHWKCERGFVIPDRLREILGFPALLPPQLDPDFIYDKWGEPIGIKGEENV
jgi:hypothetical protein